jgi:hypothetical protein
MVLHTWHMQPWTLMCCVCALSAVVPSANSRAPRLLLGVQATVLSLLLANLALRRTANDFRSLQDGYWTGQRDTVYRGVAGYLTSHANPGDWFASIEVGTIAYYSDLPAYDLSGLVTDRSKAPDGRRLRFFVYDKAFLHEAPPLPVAASIEEGDFLANIYDRAQRHPR